MGREKLYRHAGVVLVRATTYPGRLEPPEDLDLDADTVVESGRVWLGRLWRRGEAEAALRVASPVLSQRIAAVLNGDHLETRQMRRLIVSTSAYLRRWQRRPTPFGLFAGVATAAVGTEPTVWFGERHRLIVRVDAQWLSGLIDSVESDPVLLPRLPVVVNNAGFVRGDRFVIPVRSGNATPGHPASLEISVRHTRPVRAALAAAAEPVPLGEVAGRLRAEFPSVSPEVIHALLAELMASRILLTSLRAPMTTVDSLAHLIHRVQEAGGMDLPNVADLLAEATSIHRELSRHRSMFPSEVFPVLDGVAERMTELHNADGPVFAVDVELSCRITVPDTVIREAEAAATTLLRLTPYPFGSPAWRDFQVRFRDRHGAGAVVPVRDLVADSGLGLPSGFLGAPRGQTARILAERDEKLLALIQHAAVDGRDEIELTESVICELAVGDHAEMIPPPRAELAFQVHTASLEALARGRFRLWVTGAPRPASSMAGRFAHLLAEADRQRLADSYTAAGDRALAVHLSFPPRREHNENITRAPQLLPDVISVSEYRDHDPGLIPLDDLAVTADATQMYLVRMSTGAQIQPYVLHALEASVQTPPLARFLADVAIARCGVYGAFDFGAARTLPFLPRVRHGRAVLSPARWRLDTADLAAPSSTAPTWEKTLSVWRDRWRVPSAVLLCQGELRLPLDLDDRLDRTLLRTRLERTGQVELREAGNPHDHSWAGRACEFLVSLTTTRQQLDGNPPRTALPITVTQRDALLPGRSELLHAQLFGHPMRFDEILTDHLHHLLRNVTGHTRSWWFRRHQDTTRPDTNHHLSLYLRLRGAHDYGTVAMQLGNWAAGLRALSLLADLNLATYQPHNGRFGHGAVMTAAEDVFAADSAAALAEITMATRGGIPVQAIAAASMVDLAAYFAPKAKEGWRWLIDQLPQERGNLDRSLRDAALLLADTASDWAALRTYPDGGTVAMAWDRRRTALAAYRERLAENRDPCTTLRALLHDHHLRVVGVDPDRERVTNRLARVAAQRQLALIHRGAP
ncbi:MAG: lantibiotic dehydratase [Pseudonocardiaceae bacterium]